MSHASRTMTAVALALMLTASALAAASPGQAAYRYATPLSLTSTTQSTSSLTFDWSDVKGAPGFRVQLSKNATMSGATYHRFAASKGTINGLARSTVYYARVAVIDPITGAKLSDYTEKPYTSAATTQSGSTTVAGYRMAVPPGLVASSVMPTSMSLDWDDVEGAARYRVQLSRSATMAGATYHRFGGSEGTIDGLDKNTTYWFRVSVVDPITGAKLSDYTQTPYPSARTLTGSTNPGGYELPVPTGLKLTAATATSLNLDWRDVPEAPYYRVQYSTNSSMSSAQYAGFSSSRGTVSGLLPGRTYYVRVAAVEAGNGAKVSDYTQKPYPTFATVAGAYRLSIPVGLRATETSRSSIRLEWEAVPGAVKYRVQISPNASMSGATYQRFTSPWGVVGGLKPSTGYYIRVAVIEPDSGAKASDYTPDPYVRAATARTDGPLDLTVGTFNIGGVDTDRVAGGDHQPWRERRAKVIDEILTAKLQVLGIQEANQSRIYNNQNGVDWTPDGDNQFLDLRNGLRGSGRDFELVNDQYYNCERHTSSNNCVPRDRGASNGTRILYDDASLDLLDSGSIRYDAQTPQTTERYLAWARFRQDSHGADFFFATTHLDPYDAAVRGRQWDELIADVQRLNTDQLPVIVTGDFNTSKFNPPADQDLPAMKAAGFGDVLNQTYRSSIASGVRALATKQTQFNSFNDYVRDLGAGGKCYCTDPTRLGNGIDYIFVSNSLKVQEYEVVADIDSSNRMRGVIPSDHHMLRSVVTLP